MKKMIIWGCLLAAAALTITTSSKAGNSENGSAGPIPIEFQGKTQIFQHVPENINGHLMVPIREVSDSWGIQVEWNAALQQVTTTKGPTRITWSLKNDEAATATGTLALVQSPYQSDGTVFVPLRSLAEGHGFQVLWNNALKSLKIQGEGEDLPIVGSADKLSGLLEESIQVGAQTMGKAEKSAVSVVSDAKTSAAAPMAAEKQKSSEPVYSTTNVQVEGVDEADVVKTDGTYIYQVNKEKVVITQSVPANELKVVSTLAFPDQSLHPIELYVDDKHLIVIGATYNYSYKAEPSVMSNNAKSMPIRPNGHQTVKAVIYDLKDKSNLKKLREVELEGNYVSSRKIGSSLYLIANQWINVQALKEASKDNKLQAAPAYRDTVAGDSFTSLPFDQIRYFPNAVVPNYVSIGAIQLDSPNETMQVTSYVGSGENVFASENNLYIATREYKLNSNMPETAMKSKIAIAPMASDTHIYKFSLEQGKVRAVANGKVPGTILNQFSMDEHEGYFRIATTTGDMWRTDENTSKNNLYVLDGTMNVAGQLEDLAPGEKIYSTRFIGDRAYMVTFKKVDPLFVIDLKNPSAPNLLGKLKIPGYSDYLHPYDENHIIGFGKDAVEALNEGDPKASTTAYYQGMKIALFDVTDVANPIEMFKESIGDRGTDSELLHNHKALLFSKEKGLLAFPVTVTKQAANSSNVRQYGQFDYQGMYVYNLSLEKGFQLRGRITHLSQEELKKAGGGWYESNLNIQRGLYIDDILYTISQGKLKANNLSTLQEVSQITLP
jgi:inhibitor of cysteine peptidase